MYYAVDDRKGELVNQSAAVMRTDTYYLRISMINWYLYLDNSNFNCITYYKMYVAWHMHDMQMHKVELYCLYTWLNTFNTLV